MPSQRCGSLAQCDKCVIVVDEGAVTRLAPSSQLNPCEALFCGLNRVKPFVTKFIGETTHLPNCLCATVQQLRMVFDQVVSSVPSSIFFVREECKNQVTWGDPP